MSSDYESASASPSSSSEEEEWNSPKKKTPSRARRAKRPTPPSRRNPQRYTRSEMEFEIAAMKEEDSESSEEEVVTRKKPRRRAPARKSRRTVRESESEDEFEESEDEVPTRASRGTPSRPTRRCAADTQRKMSSAVKADRISEKEALADALDESEAEMLESSSSESDAKPKARKRKVNDSDDDEYQDGLFNEDSSDNDSEEEEYESESDDGRRRRSSRPQRRCADKKSYTVDDQDVGTADEESADEDAGPSILVSPSKNSTMPYGSPKLREKARARRKPLAESSDDDSHNMTYFQHKNAQKNSPSKLKTTDICCPSTHDEITMMHLPKGKPHICYVTPDKQNRHCFTIETMYRIAISKMSESNNTFTNNGRLQFLQPPHFRMPISDELLMQIECRFGREAVVIEDSALYKKLKSRSTGNFRGDIDDEMDEFDSDGEYIGPSIRGGALNFDERLQSYLSKSMGSQDIYCCPLCYNEAYRRMGNEGDEEMMEDDASDAEEDDAVKEDRFSFLDDPMTILGSTDNHKFAVASTFCFRLLSGVKNHLKSVHHVNVTVVEGNDLYKRFQIRASDGLLQSWLRKSLKLSMAQPMHLQGDMMRYWNGGENQSFLLLLDRIETGELEGQQSGVYGSNFSESFPNRARKIWEEVSSPFLKVQYDMDMKHFLADDEEDEGSTGVPINPHFTPPTKNDENLKSPEEEMLEFLKRKTSQNGAASSSENDDSSSSESESSGEDELEVLSREEEEQEEEEDQWMKSKGLAAARQKAKRRAKRNETDSDDDLLDGIGTQETPTKDNGETFGTDDSDEEKPSAGKTSSGRKRVAESSDDED